MPVKRVPSMGWTTRSVGVSVLLAVEEHRKQAGRRLVQLRDARGWSQEDLAHAAGLSIKTVSRFENGRHDGRRTTIKALVKALGVSEVDLLGEPPAPLGLGVTPDNQQTQLDRIEAKIDQLVELLSLSPQTHDDLAGQFQQALDGAQAARQADGHNAAPPASARGRGRRREAR